MSKRERRVGRNADFRTIVIEGDERGLAAGQIHRVGLNDRVGIAIGNRRHELKVERALIGQQQRNELVEDGRRFRAVVIDRQELLDRDGRRRRVGGVLNRNAEDNEVVAVARGADHAADDGAVLEREHDIALGVREAFQRRVVELGDAQIGGAAARQHKRQFLTEAVIRPRSVGAEIRREHGEVAGDRAGSGRDLADRVSVGRRS